MKPLEEMTDLEIAEKLMWIAAEFDSDSGDDYDADVLSWLAEAKRRLSAHPAQRIADLSGCVVTKDEDGEWRMWSCEQTPIADTQDGVWRRGMGSGYCSVWTVVKIHADNIPWQESIYRPKR